MTRAASLPDSSRRFHQRTTRRAASNEMRCTPSVPAPEPVHHELAPSPRDRVSAAIYQLPIKVVANITGASVDTVKSWRSGRRFPEWDYLKRLRRIPGIRELVAEEFELSVPHSPATIIAGLQQLANDSTPEAAEMRASFMAFMRGGK